MQKMHKVNTKDRAMVTCFLRPTDSVDKKIAANSGMNIELIQLLEAILQDSKLLVQALMIML